jgi:heme-degrading monooxygenase HmoA
MVMTILEAQVAPDRIEDLERAYQEGTTDLPPEIVETFLVQNAQDVTLLKIVTIWASREALDKMRASVEKPQGVLMFEAAGATPKLSILDVVAHRQN